MGKLILLIFGLCCLPPMLFGGECDQFDADLIRVEEARWCNDVNVDSRECRHPIPADVSQTAKTDYKPLYLWTRISGKEDAIRKLERCGKLPIYHKWYVSKFYGTSKETAQLIDEIPLCTGGEKRDGVCYSVAQVAEKLRSELQKQTFFDWTTWSYKERIYRGVWQVRILYNDDTAVMCGNVPCVYPVQVKP